MARQVTLYSIARRDPTCSSRWCDVMEGVEFRAAHARLCQDGVEPPDAERMLISAETTARSRADWDRSPIAIEQFNEMHRGMSYRVLAKIVRIPSASLGTND